MTRTTIELLAYAGFAALLVTLLVYGLVRALCKRRTWTPGVSVGLAAWIVATVAMTVRPGSAQQRINLELLQFGGPGGVLDAVLNAAVFVPPAVLVATVGWRFLLTILAALGVSAAIEVTQYVTNLGRSADINDLLTNTLGALAGWGLARLIDRRVD